MSGTLFNHFAPSLPATGTLIDAETVPAGQPSPDEQPSQALHVLSDQPAVDSQGLVPGSPPALKPLCFKCGYEVDVWRAHIKNKSKDSPKYICRDCNCISTILSKRLDLSQLEFSGMPKETAQEFWRNCAKKKDADSQFQYSKIRATLMETCIQQRLSSSTVTVKEESLPLSVWAQRGFDTSVIESSATKESHPILGDVYKVPLRTVERAEVAQIVKEQVFKAERSLKRKAVSSGSTDAQGAGADIIDLDEFEDDAVEPVPPSAPQSSRVQTARASANKPATQAAAAAKQEARRSEVEAKKHRALIEKANNKTFVLATKTMGSTTTVLLELETSLRNKNERIPDFILSKMESLHSTLAGYKVQASAALSKTKQAATKGVQLDQMTFTQMDVCENIKEANQYLSKFKKMQSII